MDVGATSCDVSLTPAAGGGRGTCSIGQEALTAGPYSASTTYPGDGDIAASPPATTPFTVSAATLFTCDISGFGSATFPVTESESPAPPTTIDAGGTFQEALGAQVTIPPSVINSFIGAGATSLTVSSQTTAEDGRVSVGGALSGAVSPNTEAASASNLPITDSALVAGTPFSFATAYNPVTWQTGPGTGAVFLIPGDLDAEVTLVAHGDPTTESISCVPQAGVGALDSTTVVPPPVAPTFQVPSPTPPLENLVSAGTDGGWGFGISNTSQSEVKGLSASVSVTDGHGPLTFDLAGMAASGTDCAKAGPGMLTCSAGDLDAGASLTIDVLVDTSGLTTGTAITGSATVTSTNASSQTTALGQIAVLVVVQRDKGGGRTRHPVGEHQALPEGVEGVGDLEAAQAEDQGEEAEGRVLVGRVRWQPAPSSSTPHRWR